MALSGPRPKPNILKLIEGNPGKRSLNDHEPQPKKLIPPCPRHLPVEAKRQWKKVCKKLYEIGVLTEIDGDALSMYCSAWAQWVDAKDKLQRFGPVVKSPRSGYPVLSPYFSIASTSFDQMRKMLAEFGMTPSSRSRISATPVKVKDSMEEMID